MNIIGLLCVFCTATPTPNTGTHMNDYASLEDALRARAASAISEAKSYRQRNSILQGQTKASQDRIRQLEHKLEERTIRVRRLEKACKIELAYLRTQDSEGFWWCTNPKHRHLAGQSPSFCGRCSVTKRVQEALEGKDLQD